MNYKVCSSVLVAACLMTLTGCGGGSNNNNSGTGTTPVESIAATSGTPQSAPAGEAFAPLVATVTETKSGSPGGSPVSGVLVTFTAPTTGASVAFTNGTNTTTMTTDANGNVSIPLTANGTAGGPYTVTATVSGAASPANFSLTNTASAPAIITATNGVTQSVAVNSAFAPLGATVLDSNNNPLEGVVVTFAAPTSGASGTFATNPISATATATTGANGVATAPAFTANSTAGSYTVTATTGSLGPANFNLTNTALTGSGPLGNGNYVFSLTGWDSGINQNGPSPYMVTGVFTVSNGAITGGEQDFIDFYTYGTQDQITTASTITTTASGNLQIVLVTGDTSIGVAGVETLHAVIFPQNSGRAFINEFDTSATGSGELDLQDATAAATTPAAGYAFQVSGVNASGAFLAVGGVLNVDGVGTISGHNSIFDANTDESLTFYQGESFSPSQVSSPDGMGRVKFTLNAADSIDFPQIVLVGYIVDANRIRLVETSDSYTGTTGGTALSQGANNGNFPTSLSGNSYVLGLTGYENVSAFQVASLLTANSNGSISGFVDYNDLMGLEPASPNPVSAPSYTVDSGTGRVTIAGVTGGQASFNLELYLDGNGNALAISLDGTDVLSGVVYQQSGGPFTVNSFNGTYAFGATGWDFADNPEFDAVGTVTTNSGSQTLAGSVDLNWLLSADPIYPDVAISGSTGTVNANGIFAHGAITGMDVTTCPAFNSGAGTCTNDTFNFYLINAEGDSIAIETDANQLTLGEFKQQ